jgi:orotate phosphoribosyltransferase
LDRNLLLALAVAGLIVAAALAHAIRVFLRESKHGHGAKRGHYRRRRLIE